MRLVQICPGCLAPEGQKHHPRCPTLNMGVRGSTDEALYTTAVAPACHRCKGKGFVITDILNGSTSKCPECQEYLNDTFEGEVDMSGAQPCNTTSPSGAHPQSITVPIPDPVIIRQPPMQSQSLTPEETLKRLAGQMGKSMTVGEEAMRRKQEQEQEAIKQYMASEQRASVKRPD